MYAAPNPLFGSERGESVVHVRERGSKHSRTSRDLRKYPPAKNMTVGPGGRLLWIVQIEEILFESCWKNIVIGPLFNAKQFIIYASSPELSGSILETWQISETFFHFKVLYNKVLAAFLCIFHCCKRLCYNDAHSDFVTNRYGESWDSSCEKTWVPVWNHWELVKKNNESLGVL